MKLRMKKMPRPLDLSRFSGASGSGSDSGSKPSPCVPDGDDQFVGLLARGRVVNSTVTYFDRVVAGCRA